MKKRIFALAIVMICIAILASTTLAYFTDTAAARNVITSGGIDIAIVEQLAGESLQPYPGEPIPVMPATAVSKIVSVHNLEEAAWIRAAYTVTVYDAAGNARDISAEELEKLILIRPDTTCWTQADGWWYYTEAVAPGAMTSPLFTEVAFSGPNMDNEYQNCTVVIDVDAQAVQYANNQEAQGWPAD